MPIAHVKLGSVVTINPRPTAEEAAWTALAPFVTKNSLCAATATVSPVMCDLSETKAPRNVFKTGDLLAARDLTAFAKGNIAQVTQFGDGTGDELGFCAKNVLVIRPDPARLDARFLLHFLRHANVAQLAGRYLAASQARHPRANAFLPTCMLPLLPLAEQVRWADALDDGLAACLQLQREIAAHDDTRQALFSDMFGGTQALTTRWPVSTLVAQLDVLIFGSLRWAQYVQSGATGQAGPANSNSNGNNGGDLLIGHRALGRNRLMPADAAVLRVPPNLVGHHTQVMAGDVLISTQYKLGRSALVPPDGGAGCGAAAAYIHYGVAILRSRRVEPCFLAAYLCSAAGMAEIERVQSAGKSPALNRAAVCAIRLPLPPRALQAQLRDALAACARDLMQIERRLAQAQTHFAVTESAAFGLGDAQRKGNVTVSGAGLYKNVEGVADVQV